MDVEDLFHLNMHVVDSLILYLEIAGSMNLSGCFATLKKLLSVILNKLINKSYLISQSMSLKSNPHPVMQIKIIFPKAGSVAFKRESGE